MISAVCVITAPHAFYLADHDGMCQDRRIRGSLLPLKFGVPTTTPVLHSLHSHDLGHWYTEMALKKNYLIAYNVISALLWFSVLGRVVLIASLVGVDEVYRGTGEFLKWTQTLALAEVAHSLLGISLTFSSLTFLQVYVLNSLSIVRKLASSLNIRSLQNVMRSTSH